MNNTSGMKRFLKSKLFFLLVLWVGLVILFTIWSSAVGGGSFLTPTVFVEIGDLLILTSFLAVGSGFLMVSGNMDLSASAIGAFSGVVVAAAMKYWGFSPVVSVVVAILSSTALGAFNGFLVNEFKFPPFIATMAMASVIRGIMQWISVEPGKIVPGPIGIRNEFTSFIADGKVLGIPYTLILAIVVFVIYGLILAKTKFGMQAYLVGGNPQASNLAGISPRKMYYILYANSGFLAGICGVISMGRIGQGRLDALALNQFTGLTAAILGGISFGGGTGNMAGVFVGLVILNTFSKGTTMVRFSTYWTTAFTGILLLGALTLDYFNDRKAKTAVGVSKAPKLKKHKATNGK